MAKPLLNFNVKVPKVGAISLRNVVWVGLAGAAAVAAWNWSNKIPYAGPYIAQGKAYVVKALGFRYPLSDALI